MDHLLSASLIMTSHFPLAHRDLLHQSQVVHIGPMDHSDFTSPKQQHAHFAPPVPEYHSSPSLNSETDDDAVFDTDFLQAPQHIPQQHHHNHNHHHHHHPASSFDATNSPSWSSMTPRAWIGEPQKLPSLEPDNRRASFGAYATSDGSVNPASTTTVTPQQLYPLAHYFDESTGTGASPPPSYMPSTSLGGGMDYYAAAAAAATASPGYRYNTALQQEQHNPGCDPRFVSPAPSVAGPSSSPHLHRQDTVVSFADVYTDPMQQQHQHTVKLEPDVPYDEDSGEDEKSDSDDLTYSTAPRRSSAGLGPRPTRTPAPEPVPNLTKKSRGRRVPTAASLYNGSVAYMGNSKNARTYVCKVHDCGKCFARSEHLKRHVRSIHTNEKPHRCPHPGCNKEFSRHDNLCQHMRVHRNYSAPKDGSYGAF